MKIFEYNAGIIAIERSGCQHFWDGLRENKGGDQVKKRVLSCLLTLALCVGALITAASENAEEYGYTSILGEYREAVRSAAFMVTDGHIWDIYVFDWEPLNWVTVNMFYFEDGESLQDRCGYAFADLNGDQRPELILLSKNYDIYAIITLLDGKTPKAFGMKHPHDGGVYYWYYLNPDNTFTMDIEGPLDRFIGTYRLNDAGNELTLLHAFGYGLDDSDYETIYYMQGNDGEKTLISEEEYDYLRSALPAGRTQNTNALAYIPLFGEQVAAKTGASTLGIRNASSPTHAGLGAYQYGPDKVLDPSEETSWQYSGSRTGGNGYRTHLILDLSATSKVETLRVKNGFWAITDGIDQYWRNNRVQEAAISFQYAGSNVFADPITHTFADEKQIADIDLGGRENVTAIMFQIESVYRGDKFDDVAVTYMEVIGYH